MDSVWGQNAFAIQTRLGFLAKFLPLGQGLNSEPRFLFQGLGVTFMIRCPLLGPYLCSKLWCLLRGPCLESLTFLTSQDWKCSRLVHWVDKINVKSHQEHFCHLVLVDWFFFFLSYLSKHLHFDIFILLDPFENLCDCTLESLWFHNFEKK